MKKYIAELLGTFRLVFGGCGSAILACNFPDNGIGFVGVSLAFGLSIVGVAYSLGSISGAHLNPAVTIGMYAAKRMDGKDAFSYIIFQMLGAIIAAFALYVIAKGNNQDIGGFAANGFGAHSPGGYSMVSAILVELITTFVFVLVILGVTDKKSNSSLAGLVIGLTLVLIHLISIPVTNTSVNPARSLSQAIFVGGWAMEQLWLFIVIPIIGGLLASFVYQLLFTSSED